MTPGDETAQSQARACATTSFMLFIPIQKNGMHPKTLFIPGLNSSSDVTTFSQKKTIKRAIPLWNHSQPSVPSSKVNSNGTSFHFLTVNSCSLYFLKSSHRKQVLRPFFNSCASSKEFLPAEENMYKAQDQHS